MKLSLRVANPAGNITIFVMNPVPHELYAEISSKLLKIDKFHAEQVAFCVAPKLGGLGRIEMMGGEFCGNATRSYGYLVSMLDKEHPTCVPIEISGSQTVLNVEIDVKKGICKTQMPLLKSVETLVFRGVSYSAMIFDGIIHIIVLGNPKDEKFIKELFALAKTQFPSDAYGIMFLEETAMTPVVYVVNTNSLIWESSCGSGSMACAIFLALREQDGHYYYRFKQPGGIIEAEVETKNKKADICKMGGPVTISGEIEIEL